MYPSLAVDITVSLRINNNSYSYKAVLAELYKTDYVITDYYSMSHSIWVDDDTGCRCILNFQPNNGIVTIRCFLQVNFP